MKKLLTLTALLLSLNALAQPASPDSTRQRRRPRMNWNQPMTDPDVHDPVMAKGEDGRYYIFATGSGVSVLSSEDLKTWKRERPVLDGAPEWATKQVPGYRGHTWAPDIIHHNGMWYLYYSCSTFGRNTSAIGLAVNKTLDPKSPDFKWIDQGMVIASRRHQDCWNAIDPNLIVDKKGNPYLTFGSFWDGIQLVQLDKDDLQTPLEKPHTIARRYPHRVTLEEIDQPQLYTIENGDTIEAADNAIEAPFIIRRGKYFYLFVSQDYCCRGQRSTYRTVYGRSKNVEGPYVDQDGVKLEDGGGTLLYGPNDDYYGIGHSSAYEFDGKWWFVAHGYDKHQNGRAKLFMREMNFDKKGWIVKP